MHRRITRCPDKRAPTKDCGGSSGRGGVVIKVDVEVEVEDP